MFVAYSITAQILSQDLSTPQDSANGYSSRLDCTTEANIFIVNSSSSDVFYDGRLYSSRLNNELQPTILIGDHLLTELRPTAFACTIPTLHCPDSLVKSEKVYLIAYPGYIKRDGTISSDTAFSQAAYIDGLVCQGASN
ncbi:hypothetical protein GJ496_004087 [Pomphorhynchus laevis]|nr:hypothetical protein GJ496_004087 [Pomphorhynchus laevis]